MTVTGIMSRSWINKDIRRGAVAASLLLSLLHALLNPMPNVDAFTYVRTAEVFLDEGLFAAFAWYPSAAYPLLIAGIHQLTGLNLFVSGQVVNALFYALLTYVFITLVMEIRRSSDRNSNTDAASSSRLALIAALTVLVFPQLNEYRYFMIRDIGAIAFILLGLLHLMRAGHGRWLQHSLLFGLSTLAAALFRAEALVYLLLGPASLLLNTHIDIGERSKQILCALAVVVALIILALGMSRVADMDLAAVLERVITVYEPFLASTAASLDGVNSPISEAVFGDYAADYSGQYIALFVISGLAAILVLKLITGFGIPALLFILQGARSGDAEQHNPAMRQAFFYAFIAFLIMLAFLLLTRFLSTRYTLMFCTTLMLMVPFVIEGLWSGRGLGTAQRTDNTNHHMPTRRIRSLLMFVLLYCAVDAHISFGDSKESVQQASDWLVANTPVNTSVVTNSAYLAYHSKRVPEYDQTSRYIDQEAILNAPFGTLLAFSLDRGVDELLADNLTARRIELVRSFPESGEPEFGIYRRIGN